MSKFLSQCTAAASGHDPTQATNNQVFYRTFIDVETELEPLADAVEAAMPNGRPHEPDINGSQTRASGRKACLYSLFDRESNSKVTVWDNGKVVWQNIAPTYPVAEAVAST